MSEKLTELYILHGWSVDHLNQQKWEPFLGELKERGVNWHFLSLPGLSSPLKQVWDLTDYVKWLKRQLPKNLKVNLLGHSFGGQLAIRYCSLSPKRVNKLILIASSGIPNTDVLARLKRSIFWVAAKTGKVLLKADIFRKILYKLAREQDYYQAPPLLRKTMAKVISDSIESDLGKLSCPTTVIWGDQDRITPIKNGKLIADKIINSKLKVVKTARHAPQFTHVSQTAKLVAESLQGTS